MSFVYILQSDKNKRYYIGSSSDIDRRLDEHNRGKVKATKSTLPFTMVFCQQFETLIEARRIESSLKKLKSKEIIDKIVTNKKISLKRL